MTSRVQKGGTLFRPVTKLRSRPPASSSARQPSIALESNATNEVDALQDASSSSLSSKSMQPPSIVPVHAEKPFFNEDNQESSHPLNTEPVDIQTRRSFSNPPLLVKHISSNPLVASTSSSQVLEQATPSSPHPSEIPLTSGDQLLGIVQTSPPRSSGLSKNILQFSGSDNLPSDGLHIDSPVKLSRAVSAKSAIVEEELSSEDTMKARSSDSTRKRTKRKSQDEGSNKGKKKRATSKTDNGDEEPSTKRTGSSETSRRRRSRVSSVPPYDPDADPGEDIDPTVVTMAALCSDSGQGRVSSKAAEVLSSHVAWKSKNREQRARMRALMEAKKYGRDEDEEISQGIITKEAAEASPEGGIDALDPESSQILDGTGSGFDYSQQMETSRFNVQVRIGPNGETIIDEESLVVDRSEVEDMANYTHVIESDTTKFVNSGTYSKRFRGSRWSAEETELFYNALSQYGENYELIAFVLPGRDRKSCKNKFKAEDKKNHARINHSLNHSIPVDIKTLSRMTGKNFSGPLPEIRTPTPVPANTEDIEDISTRPHATQEDIHHPQLAKKGSRGKILSSEEEVVVIGNVDTFAS